jgi:hypothetical protein
MPNQRAIVGLLLTVFATGCKCDCKPAGTDGAKIPPGDTAGIAPAGDTAMIAPSGDSVTLVISGSAARVDSVMKNVKAGKVGIRNKK